MEETDCVPINSDRRRFSPPPPLSPLNHRHPSNPHLFDGPPPPPAYGHYYSSNQSPLHTRQMNHQNYPHHRDRPPGRPKPHTPPNFIIQLRAVDSKTLPKKLETETVISKLTYPPERTNICSHDYLHATLFYSQWFHALESFAQLWELKLINSSNNFFTPRLIKNVEVPSDKEEVRERLKALFLDKLKELMDEGEAVRKWEKKLVELEHEIRELAGPRRKPRALRVYEENLRKKKGFEKESELISKRLEEFRCGLRCIMDYLESDGIEEIEEDLKVFRLGKDFVWERIYALISRECRRLDDGLPIYAYRREILRQVHCQQITVLIGETGSGKSTQLVQFLADSGVAGNGTIVCTQPRKIAALSLAQRVKEESSGCHQDAFVSSCSSNLSIQQVRSKVLYVTDHCLLQHYMRDKNLSHISCIIVDEAHERSINTDLLLALVKKLLCQRLDLRLIIMSATANADQLADYFFGCGTFYVAGRNYPVDIKYIPCASDETSCPVASYVSDVVRVAHEIHKVEKEGTVLAFLTSQMEVEWACEKFQAPLAIALPLHGKLSYEDQRRVFHNYPGKRKVIFSTNVAETSLTIPGVKYVVDCGMVKENRFEPETGMSVLKVFCISQSSANQRAGRAGRTEPGICYRLYSEDDFASMARHHEPEIRRIHLGIAVLRILALGVENVREFDFVDAPSADAIDMAIRNLIHIGAVTLRNDNYELTVEGRKLVRLGIEPRLGKIILDCCDHRLGREGLVLAAVMANASSIFCRVGNEEDKLKADCLKVQFCHPSGDLFTLLAVYKEWESVEKKNVWCWDNRINAKTMRRCHETVLELESCLQNELNTIIPSYWLWNPQMNTEHDGTLRTIILSSLAENVAMYSGYDQLGYAVVSTGKHVKLHPSCSLLVFTERPTWVVFSEILSMSNEYLACVTAFDFKSLSTLRPPPSFDFSKMETRKLHRRVLTGFGTTLLKRFCGKGSSSLRSLVACMRARFMDDRIGVEVDIDRNEIMIFAASYDLEKVCGIVNDALGHDKTLLQNECLEKSLYNGGGTVSSSIALFGAGAEIKHLELEKRCLSVDIYHSDLKSVDDKELLLFVESYTKVSICGVHKFYGVGHDSQENEKWGKITFLTPDAANLATEINGVEFCGGVLKVVLSQNISLGDQNMFATAALKAKICWPRRCSRGLAIVRCHPEEVALMVNDLSDLIIGGHYVRCEPSIKCKDSILISGLDRELSEMDIYGAVSSATDRKILDLFLLRGKAVENISHVACEEAIVREISPFVPKRNSQGTGVRVQVFPPEPKDVHMKAMIIFDGSLHLEAARALEQIDGKVLPGCLPWQRIKCQRQFHSSVSCPAPVYYVIKNQLDSLLARFRRRRDIECSLDRNDNGSYRVKISASATKTVAELRRPLEQLMKGKVIDHAAITPSVLQLLFSRDGTMLKNSIERETGTYILFDKHSLVVRVFGSLDKIDVAQLRFVKSLLALYESKQLEVHLHGRLLPPDLMKRVVQKFGPDLHGLKMEVSGAEFSLNTKRQCILISGSREVKQKVEEVIYEIAQTSNFPVQKNDSDAACPICLCEVEDGYKLEGCGHEFCSSCLVEQCESAIRSQDSFPVCCTHKGCGALILLADLRSLLSSNKLEELFRASLGAFVAGSRGMYRFCPSPDCPNIYKVAGENDPGAPFMCSACYVETCNKCHVEYHPFLSCEKYREFKDDPDTSLKEWCTGKENVKKCPVCGCTIEKVDGCNHVECRCGKHVCWTCLEVFASSDDCYSHLRSVHLAII